MKSRRNLLSKFIVILISSLVLTSCDLYNLVFETSENSSTELHSSSLQEIVSTSSLTSSEEESEDVSSLNTSNGHIHHALGGGWKYDDKNHYHICSCGEKMDVEQHTFVSEVVIEPTFFLPGKSKFTCKKCSYVRYEDIPTKTHSNHEYNLQVINDEFLKTEATCLDKAVYYYSCECGKKGTETFTYGEPLGHNVVIDERVEPTSTKTGLTEGSHCSRCGEVIVPQEVIPVLTISYSPRRGNNDYGFYALNKEENGENMQRLYLKMYEACEELISSHTNVTSIQEGFGHYIKEFNYASYSLNTEEALSVWSTFVVDNPRYYFLSNNIVYDQASRILLTIDDDYINYSSRSVYDADIDSISNDVVSLTTNVTSSKSKYIKIHDYIINRIDYAYIGNSSKPETAIWAHNMIGVSSKGKGVCEAYSKSYLYLTKYIGLDCINVLGKVDYQGSNGDHAWNYIKVDSKWYMVDCTWDDLGEGHSPSYSFFGLSESNSNQSRTPATNVKGKDFQTTLPTLNSSNLILL